MTTEIEFGAPVRNRFKFSASLDAVGRESTAAPMLGKAIFGLATSYFEIHTASSGQTEIFAPGCFDETLKSGARVALLVNHRPERKISDGDRLELFSDRDGLWLRFWPTDHKAHQDILAAVGDGTLAQLSVGYEVHADAFFKMRGIDHRIINRATLREISFVAGGRAAVKSTSAIVVDGSGLHTNLSDDAATEMAAALRARIRSCC